ncbi:MAG: 50S ribosomal protein L4 [Candidatus Zixiibacteriota bacterium]|nr:MAG: 50S ribosomal protein L4 [candidate division Zixibacteria bacterium]
MTVKVYSQDGSEVGTVELKDAVFGVEPNEAAVHQYLVNLLARQRQGSAATKTRKDVVGGGHKPWRQKGTGRARAGTASSPLWRGGGTVFGPSPKKFGTRFPKQMKRLAIRSIFSQKAKSGAIKIIDAIELEEFKTKSVRGVLTLLDLNDKKCLILDEGRNDKLRYSCRNLPKVLYSRASLTNGYDILNADVVLLTKAGLQSVEEVFA